MEAGKPLHYTEIARRVVQSKLWMTTGKTPENAINHDINQEIMHRGKLARFVRLREGCIRPSPSSAERLQDHAANGRREKQDPTAVAPGRRPAPVRPALVQEDVLRQSRIDCIWDRANACVLRETQPLVRPRTPRVFFGVCTGGSRNCETKPSAARGFSFVVLSGWGSVPFPTRGIWGRGGGPV